MAITPDPVIKALVPVEPPVDDSRILNAERHIDSVLSDKKWVNENALINSQALTFWVIESGEHELSITELAILRDHYKKAGWTNVHTETPIAWSSRIAGWTITLGVFVPTHAGGSITPGSSGQVLRNGAVGWTDAADVPKKNL